MSTKLQRHDGGITLIELLCVIGIIMILLGFYTGAIQRGFAYARGTLKEVARPYQEK